MTELYVIIPLITVCLLFSAFFSSAEIAYTSLNRVRLEGLAEDGNRRARMALKIRDGYDFTLSSLLIGNALVNNAVSSITAMIALGYATAHAVSEGTANTVGTLIATVVVLIVGEIVPKIIAKQHALGYALAIAYPLRFITLLFTPVSRPVAALVDRIRDAVCKKDAPTVTEDELSVIFETAEEEGVVDEDQGDLLKSALDYRETTVEDILNPRINIIAVDIDDPADKVREVCLSSNHSRLPVYRESIDHIVGILTVNHYLRRAAEDPDTPPPLEEMLNEPYYVHKTAKLPLVLSGMRKRQMHMAIVMDEYGGTMGMVTMEDILEEIVGDIWDESDSIEEDDIVSVNDDTYEVDGMTPIADFFEELDIDDRDFESEYTTMGGWAVEMLEEDPHEGDSFEWKNLYVIVTEIRDNLVSRLSVKVREDEAAEE